MKIEHTIDIEASPSRVWDLTLDIESWPEYTPTMSSVERLDDGPLTVGSQAKIVQPGQRSKVWTVTDLEPERAFAWTTRAFGMSMTGGHYLASNGGSTRQTLTVEIEGSLVSVLGPLLRRPILTAITRENEGFKAAAESN